MDEQREHVTDGAPCWCGEIRLSPDQLDHLQAVYGRSGKVMNIYGDVSLALDDDMLARLTDLLGSNDRSAPCP